MSLLRFNVHIYFGQDKRQEDNDEYKKKKNKRKKDNNDTLKIKR